MTTDTLTWSKTKDAIILGLGSSLIGFLAFIAYKQDVILQKISDLDKNTAVQSKTVEMVQADLVDVRQRLFLLETERNK